MKKIWIILLMIGCLVVGALGWSLLNKPTTITISSPNQPVAQNPKVTASPNLATNIPQPTVAKTNEPTATTLPTSLVYANPSVVIDAIETAIPAKTYNDLLPLMLEKVNLIKYATSCCGLISKTQAISELLYLNNAVGPWDFSETNPIAAKLETNDPEHFKDMWIGTSADFHAVGFKWNDDFLIEKISIVNDYHLITGQ